MKKPTSPGKVKRARWKYFTVPCLKDEGIEIPAGIYETISEREYKKRELRSYIPKEFWSGPLPTEDDVRKYLENQSFTHVQGLDKIDREGNWTYVPTKVVQFLNCSELLKGRKIIKVDGKKFTWTDDTAVAYSIENKRGGTIYFNPMLVGPHGRRYNITEVGKRLNKLAP